MVVPQNKSSAQPPAIHHSALAVASTHAASFGCHSRQSVLAVGPFFNGWDSTGPTAMNEGPTSRAAWVATTAYR